MIQRTCRQFIVLTILITVQGCNTGTNLPEENLNNLPIYTQADMDSVLQELEEYKNASQACTQVAEYTCPAQAECTPSHFGPEVCEYACTVEKYSCIYKCWDNTDGYKCTEICQEEYRVCEQSC